MATIGSKNATRRAGVLTEHEERHVANVGALIAFCPDDQWLRDVAAVMLGNARASAPSLAANLRRLSQLVQDLHLLTLPPNPLPPAARRRRSPRTRRAAR